MQRPIVVDEQFTRSRVAIKSHYKHEREVLIDELFRRCEAMQTARKFYQGKLTFLKPVVAVKRPFWACLASLATGTACEERVLVEKSMKAEAYLIKPYASRAKFGIDLAGGLHILRSVKMRSGLESDYWFFYSTRASLFDSPVSNREIQRIISDLDHEEI